MSDSREDREFQLELTKLQVDFEYMFTVLIGIIAILYGLLVFYRDNSLLYGVNAVLIAVAAVLLILLYISKERKFKEIRRKYIHR